MRIGDVSENPDIDVIRHLAREIGVATSEDALKIAAEFCPSNILEPKAGFGLEEILDGASGTEAPPEISSTEEVSERSKRPGQYQAAAHAGRSRPPGGEWRAEFPAVREFLDVSYANPDERQAAISQQPCLWTPYEMPVWRRSRNISHAPTGWRFRTGPKPRGSTCSIPSSRDIFQSLKARLTEESPSAVRRRMLFVSADALFRSRAIQPDP